jgi:hypothetical protein
VTSSSEAKQSIAELLAAAQICAQTTHRPGMLQPVTLPWWCAPTLLLAGTDIVVLWRSPLNRLSLKLLLHCPRRAVVVAALCSPALLLLACYILDTTCKSAGASDNPDYNTPRLFKAWQLYTSSACDEFSADSRTWSCKVADVPLSLDKMAGPSALRWVTYTKCGFVDS